MSNDLTFVIVALEKVDTAMGHVAAQLEMLSEKIDRLDGKKAKVDVEVDTEKASQGLNLIQSRWQAIAAAIVVASPVIGAAILAGVGVGFVGVAALAQKSNQDVSQAYKTLWQDVTVGAKNATDQLVPQLVGGAHQISTAVNQLGPQITQGMALAGPEIVALSRGISDMAHNAMPGLLAAMQSNMPVIQALSGLMGTVGTIFSNTLTTISQHSNEFAVVLHSLGSIVQSVFGAATTILDDLTVAYAANASNISAAIQGIASVLGALAAGVLPVLTVALGATATAISALAAVIGPVAPIIGIAVAALVAKKLALGGVESAIGTLLPLYNKMAQWVTSVANGFRDGAGMSQLAADKFTVMSEAQKKAAVAAAEQAQATAKATAQTAQDAVVSLEAAAKKNVEAVSEKTLAAARETATAAAAAETEATAALAVANEESAIAMAPVGAVILGVAAVIGIFAATAGSAQTSAVDLQSSIDSMTSAFERSHGAVDKSVIDSLTASDAFKAAAAAAQKQGISQSQLTQAIISGGPALDQMRASLQAVISAHEKATDENVGRRFAQQSGDISKSLDAEGQAAKDSLDKLNAAIEAYGKGQSSAEDLARTQRTAAVALVATAEYQDAAANSAKNLGLSITSVSAGYQKIIAEGGSASASVLDVGQAFDQLRMKVSAAEIAISDHFQQADLAVAQAKQTVNDASHSNQAAIQGVIDARHAEAQAARGVAQANEGVANASHAVQMAERSLQDAYANVTTAQDNYAKAVEKEQVAETALHQAREQAVQDLKAIHLQLEDQIQAEESANVRLFEAQQTAATFGINSSNVHDIAAQQVSWSNVDRVKAAINLVSAENAVNDTLNKGVNLREDVAAADAAGVDRAKNVIAAQDAVTSAQDQVRSSATALVKANQQVGDASYALQQAQAGLTKAHQAVSDAAWGLQKAHLAVTDAQYQQGKAAEALKQDQDKLKIAQDGASRSLDLNTKAGQENYALLQTLSTALKNEFGPSADAYNTLIQQTADKFGITTGAAQDLLDRLHLIPQNFQFGMTSVASANFDELNRVYNDKFGERLGPIATNVAHAFAAGGPVRGVGGPRDDMNLAWLSNREFVQPVDSVDHYGEAFMEAVRTKRFPKFASGGSNFGAPLNYLLAGAGTAYQTSVDALTVMGLPHPQALPVYVPPPVAVFAGPTGGSAGPDAASAQAYAASQMSVYGWGQDQMAPLLALWTQESNWHWWALNKSSGAYGIPQCYSTDVRILTGRGWLTHDEVQVGDVTIGYNEHSGRSEWTRVTEVLHPGVHRLVHFGNSYVSFTATPNHRWLMRHENTKAESLTAIEDRTLQHTLLLAKEAQLGAGSLDITDNEAALLGWIAGDGWQEKARVKPRRTPDRGRKNWHRSMTYHICQTKEPNWEAIEKAIDGNGTVARTRERLVHGELRRDREWRLSAPYARDLTDRAGNPKTDSFTQVLRMSDSQRKAWLEAVWLAEGSLSRGHREISQCEGDFAEAIKVAIYLDGHRPGIYRDERYTKVNLRIGFARPTLTVDNPGFFYRDAGFAEVWCVRTELGSWTAEQNGHIHLTGNSLPASKMAAAGPDWLTNPATQINWGLNYIRGRYGSPAGAEAHERSFNWYGNGDVINTPTLGILGESGPEVVLPLSRPGRASQLAERAGLHEKHYHLTVYNAANNEINLRAQFKRLEIESGML